MLDIKVDVDCSRYLIFIILNYAQFRVLDIKVDADCFRLEIIQ